MELNWSLKWIMNSNECYLTPELWMRMNAKSVKSHIFEWTWMTMNLYNWMNEWKWKNINYVFMILMMVLILIDWLIWLIDIDWSIDWLIWLIDSIWFDLIWFIDWLDWLDWLIWLIDWLVDWLIDGLIDWLIDWVMVSDNLSCLSVCHSHNVWFYELSWVNPRLSLDMTMGPVVLQTRYLPSLARPVQEASKGARSLEKWSLGLNLAVRELAMTDDHETINYKQW